MDMLGLFGFYKTHGNVTLAVGTDRKGGFLCTHPFDPQNPQDEATAILIPVF